MKNHQQNHEALRFEAFGIDREMSLELLERVNVDEGRITDADRKNDTYRLPGSAEGDPGSILTPDPDHLEIEIDASVARERLESVLQAVDVSRYGSVQATGKVKFTYEGIHRLGLHILRRTAYGILNGGSATSYIDEKRNRAYMAPLFEIIEPQYRQIAEICRGRPKALAPAFVHPDGSPGYTFIEMKLRALLLAAAEAGEASGRPLHIPLFEMRSAATDSALSEAYALLSESPLLAEASRYIDNDIGMSESRLQPLTAALTHSASGLPRRFFTDAYGRADSLLALPGGHGQNFKVLSSVYRDLQTRGYRFACLVNIDNLGNYPDPVHIALTLLTGSPASFEFSRKTPGDTKGGIFVLNSRGQAACVDIGAAISQERVLEAERKGSPVLFNCASGIFDLDYLTEHLDEIIGRLPVRVSEQDKDAGKYAQAEQITWEVMELLPEPLIIAVEKSRRFLAAKLLSEMLITSQAEKIVPLLLERIHENSIFDQQTRLQYENFCQTSLDLQKGLEEMLEHVYGLQCDGNRWKPVTVREFLAARSDRY